MNKQYYEYLKALHPKWYENHDELISVANILDDEGYFKDTSEVIVFFEKPWHWNKEIAKLVEEYDDTLLMANIRASLESIGENKNTAYNLSYSLFDDVKDYMDSGLSITDAITKAREVLDNET